MNKSELISAMAAEAQMSKADAKKALDAFISSVTNAMKAGDKVVTKGVYQVKLAAVSSIMPEGHSH